MRLEWGEWERNGKKGMLVPEPDHVGPHSSFQELQLFLWKRWEAHGAHICSWGGIWFYLNVKVKVTQLCLTLCDPKVSIVLGILQARTLEWVAFPFSSGSFWPRNWTGVSCIAGGFFTSWAIREPLSFYLFIYFYLLVFKTAIKKF